jgi:hypothetical protein
MANFVIERRSDAISTAPPDGLTAILAEVMRCASRARSSDPVGRELRDRRTIGCVHRTSEADLVREYGSRGGFLADSASAVTAVINRTTGEG